MYTKKATKSLQGDADQDFDFWEESKEERRDIHG